MSLKREGDTAVVYLEELPVYRTMKDCSAQTGIPVHVLKYAKDNGCCLERSGKIRLSEFLRWFFSQSETGEDQNFDKRLKRAKALNAEANYEEKMRSLISFAVVDAWVQDLLGNCVFGEQERIMEEFPATLKGKSELVIHKECKRQLDGFVKKINSKLLSLETMGPKGLKS